MQMANPFVGRQVLRLPGRFDCARACPNGLCDGTGGTLGINYGPLRSGDGDDVGHSLLFMVRL